MLRDEDARSLAFAGVSELVLIGSSFHLLAHYMSCPPRRRMASDPSFSFDRNMKLRPKNPS